MCVNTDSHYKTAAIATWTTLVGAVFITVTTRILSEQARAFVGVGFLIFPNIIPPSITIYQAAAAPSSLVFMLTFIGFLIPIMLAYNVYNYVVFRGKVVGDAYGE